MGAASNLTGLLAAVILAGCGNDELVAPIGAAVCEPSTTLEFVAAPGLDEQEAYVCFGFDATRLRGTLLGGLNWTPPVASAVALHHATLLATAEDYPEGPIECGPMPSDAVGLHVWAPGGAPLMLPRGIGLELPASVRHLIVEAHVFRHAAGDAGIARAELCALTDTPQHRAGWLGVPGPVPAIRPRSVESGTGRCTMTGAFTLISSWPHMHFLGKEFHGAVIRRDGTRLPLIDLPTWDFNAQRTYPLDVRLEPGDTLETTCVWENPTEEYVLPGLLTTDEMCNQGFIGWPKDSARCEPTP
jgi:hypothetical protein